jgi:hypothetical protein
MKAWSEGTKGGAMPRKKEGRHRKRECIGSS